MATDALHRPQFQLRGPQRDWMFLGAILLLVLWMAVVAYVVAQFGKYGGELVREEQQQKIEGASHPETRPLE